MSLALAALLCAGALAVAAGGCGSSQATLDPVAQAAEATTHSGGSQIAMTVTVTAPGLGSPLTVKGNGNFNMARKEGELLFNLEGLPPSAQLPSGPLSITELFKDGAIYMSSPLFEGKLPGGAKWMKLDLAKFESSLGLDPRQLTSGQSDPAQYLQYLRSAGGSVRAVGHETVRGTDTTRYEGSIDLNKAAEALPATDRAKLKEALKSLASQTGVSSIPVTVWVDAHHLIRRMSMKISIAAGGKTGGATVDYELFGFGATPAVNPPASGETFDATKLSLQALSGGG
jgi:hypothetical protein